MSFLRRGAAAADGKAGITPFADAKFQKDWPALFEYMTSLAWPDGVARRPSSLTLFSEDGQLKACLSEKNDNLVLFAAGKTLLTCLNALEGLLTADEVPWRQSAFQAGPKPAGGRRRG